MKKKFFLALLSFICLATTFYGQRYQVTTGTSRQEEKWAVVEDPSINRFVAIGNTTATGLSQVWISSYTSNGTIASTATLSDFRDMIARDISIAPNDNNGKPTYYVTGWTNVNGYDQMFVTRVDLNGTALWLEINPAFPEAEKMEGVAIVTEPFTNDAVALGIVYFNGAPQVTISRFNAGGGLVWSNVYAEKGNWMPREIDLGRPGVAADEGRFIITGEVVKDPGTVPQTFAALYDDNGAEMWRNLYPAQTSIETLGDAGYDVVYEPRTRNFCVVGVAQTTDVRAGVTSTPYILNIDYGGALIASTVYLEPSGAPMGLYPRCVSLGREPGDGAVIFAGPDYKNNRVFLGVLPTIAPPGAGLFENFGGVVSATANSVPQPFVLNDAWPEDILYARLDNNAGALISSNSVPGSFGAGDGHFIKTDAGWRTPADCPEKILEHIPKESLKQIPQTHQVIHLPDWQEVERVRNAYPVEQKTCVENPCNVKASFTYSVNCKTVTFTNTSTGTGPFTYNWNFGDATTSTLANPVKTYTNCGNYTVRLIVCSPVCCDTIIQTVNVPCCSVTSDFCVTMFGRVATLNINTAANPPVTTYRVYLNTVDVTTTWLNNTNRTLLAGNNTICVKATRIACGDTCCSTSCKTVFATDTCNLVANFWFQVRNTGQVVFTNQSTPAAGLTYAWDFGAAGGTSTLASPTYTYSAPGTYNACLVITRISGMDTCQQKVCKTIVIDPPCSVQAKFKSRHCVTTPLTVAFTNMSTPAAGLTYAWDFGVAGGTSTLANPSYTYTAPGTYIVCLKTLVNNNCWSRSCHKVIVSSVTSNNSCTVLPGTPTFRLADPLKDPLIVENVMELVSQDASPNNVLLAKQPDKPVESAPTDKLSLFPNPASQQVQAAFISNSTMTGEIMVINAAGKIVYKQTAPVANGKNQIMIPVRNLPNGIYRVSIRTNDRVLSGNFFVDNR
jgi:PKD repeat protein